MCAFMAQHGQSCSFCLSNSLLQMREVLGAGLQLGVDMPQVEELRLEIKK